MTKRGFAMFDVLRVVEGRILDLLDDPNGIYGYYSGA